MTSISSTTPDGGGVHRACGVFICFKKYNKKNVAVHSKVVHPKPAAQLFGTLFSLSLQLLPYLVGIVIIYCYRDSSTTLSPFVAVFYVEALNYTFNLNLKELNIKITINK
jgi:hypothetical protein